MKNRQAILLASLWIAVAAAPSVWSQSSNDPPTILYTGKFETNNGTMWIMGPNYLFDLRAQVYDAPTGGKLLHEVVTQTATDSNGVFTVELGGGLGDWSSSSSEAYFDLGVRETYSSTWTPLSPRQKIHYQPKALFALTAERARSLDTGAVTTVSLQDGSVTAAKLAPGATAGNLMIATGPGLESGLANNELTLNLKLTPGNGIKLEPSGPELMISAARSCNDYTNCYWNLLGNGNIDPGTHFLGTIAGELAPLEFRVNDNRTMLYAFTGPNDSPSIAGGYKGNIVSGTGATIGGGGRLIGINKVLGPYNTVGGGVTNVIEFAAVSTIGGGEANTIQHDVTAGTIGGGSANTIYPMTYAPTISGGMGNAIGTGQAGTIGGGNANRVDAAAATVSGGTQNLVQSGANAATVSGGEKNVVGTNSAYATIGGGDNNQIYPNADYSTVAGGYANAIRPDATYSIVGGGYFNLIMTNADYGTIGGGQDNTIATNVLYATIPGGYRAEARLYGQVAHASGRFAADGDAQASCYVLRTNTTSSIPAELFLDGLSRRLRIPAGGTWAVDVLVVARSSTGNSAGYHTNIVVENVGGVAAFVPAAASVTVPAIGEDVAAWNVTLAPLGDAMAIRVVTAESMPSNIRWVATVRTAEVIY